MTARRPVLLVATVAAVALCAFVLGTYVLPHTGPSSTPLSDTAAATTAGSSEDSDTAALAEYGIDVSTSSDAPQTAARASGGDTSDTATLTAESLATLEEPAEGLVIGRIISVGNPEGTAEVEADLFTLALENEDGVFIAHTLPAGATVSLVWPSARSGGGDTLPIPGSTIQAEVRVEPATSTTPARISVTKIEVIGS